MSLLDLARRAVIHHETYITILKGLLPHGSERSFARDVLGITPNYLSDILNIEHKPPSPVIAEAISAALPLDTERKLALLEHLLLAHEDRLNLIQSLAPLWEEPLLAILQTELYAANKQAEQGGNTKDTFWYQLVAEVGQAILRQFDPSRDLLDYVQICLLVQNALAVLNRHEGALYTAKLATALLETRNPHDFGTRREYYNSLWVNSWYAQAVAARNANQHREAFHLNQHISAIIASDAPEQRRFWLPHNLTAQLEALSSGGRFSLYEARSLYSEVQRLAEGRDYVDTQQLLLLNDKAIINAYVHYGSASSLHKAQRLAQQLADKLSNPNVKTMPIQRATALTAIAGAYYRNGDLDAWRYFLQELISLCGQAGLTHQLARARQVYGTAVEEIIAGIDNPTK